MAKASKKGASAPAKNRSTKNDATSEVTEVQATATEQPAATEETPKPVKAKRSPAVVQHGISRPRSGGLCAAVWEITEARLSHNEATGEADWPTISEVKAAAQERGLNPTNVAIEYYRCRQFHGVRGRQAKKPAPTEAQA